MPQPTLSTARLVLRPFTPSDAPAVQRLAGDWKIADTTALIPHPYPEGAAEAWIATHAAAFAAGTQVTFAIALTDVDDVVGAIGLMLTPTHRKAELGYWIGVPGWGRGYATEAARAIVEFGFRTLQLHRVQARHLTRNPASGRVLEKIGMRLEGIHRESQCKWGMFEDVAHYAVLAAEWE